MSDTESLPGGSVRNAAGPQASTSTLPSGEDDTAPVVAAHPGQIIGRYEIVELLGAGGMSQVFTAIDLELRRTVALKLMRPRGAAPSPLSRARLLREAHALAKLQHPNVVAIHDVGTEDDRVFIAMELVPGETLGAWLAAGPRPWSAIRDVFLAAGRGLAAAHAVGIVHRDFKPSNVIVGESRVVVVDFGLARGDGLSSEEEDRMAIPTPLDVNLTLTGERPGTPRYMAPEQHTGGPVTAFGDQFSFAAALWEALTGAPPFAGTNRAEVVEAMARPLARPPADRKVPDRVRIALARALAFRPEKRWPTLTELLNELARDPAVARRRRLAVVAAAVAAMAVPVAFLAGKLVPVELDPCDGGTKLAASMWGSSAHARARAAFLASGRPTAEASFERVDAAMRDKLAAWAAAHRDTCEATRVRHLQSERLLDLRMACLERARGELGAFVEALGRDLDGNGVDRAVGTSARALDLTACQDVVKLQVAVPPPRDPDAARLVTELGAEVDRLKADLDLGRAPSALAAARALLPRVRQANYPPLAARALWIAGQLEIPAGKIDDGIDFYYQSAHAAQQAHDDIAYARALSYLIRPVGELRGRMDEAATLMKLAEGAAERAGNKPEVLIPLFRHEGEFLGEVRHENVAALARFGLALAVAHMEPGPDSVETGLILKSLAFSEQTIGRLEDAVQHYRRAMEILIARLGPDHPLVNAALSDLAGADQLLGNWDLAADLYRTSLERSQRGFGRDNLHVLIAETNLASVLWLSGRLVEARALIDHALSIAEGILGPKNPSIAHVLNAAADISLDEGKVDEALAEFRRAVGIVEAKLGPESPGLVLYLVGLTDAELAAGHVPEARRAATRAVAILRKTDPASPSLADALRRDGDVLTQERRHAEAVARFDEALAIAEKVNGPDHPRVMWILRSAVESLVATGQAPRAVAFAERAQAIASTHGPRVLAQSELALARALVADGRDRSQAVAVAQAARARLEGTGCRRLQGQIDAWLADAARPGGR